MSACGCKWDGALDGKRIRCKQHNAEYLAEKNKLTPEQVAVEAMGSEAMLWLMCGSNHPEAQLSVLRRYWEKYIEVGGKTWGKR